MDKFTDEQVEFLKCIGVEVRPHGESQAVYNTRASNAEGKLCIIRQQLLDMVASIDSNGGK